MLFVVIALSERNSGVATTDVAPLPDTVAVSPSAVDVLVILMIVSGRFCRFKNDKSTCTSAEPLTLPKATWEDRRILMANGMLNNKVVIGRIITSFEP